MCRPMQTIYINFTNLYGRHELSNKHLRNVYKLFAD